MKNRNCIDCAFDSCDSSYEPCRSCYNTLDKPNFICAESAKKVLESAVELAEAVDMVNQPPHYKQGGMETIDEMILIFGKEAVANFCICNAWKYRARALYKNQDEDMKKSHWYINKYKELMGV